MLDTSKNCVATQNFLVDTNSRCIYLLLLHSPSLAQKPLCLVGTFLNYICAPLWNRVPPTMVKLAGEVVYFNLVVNLEF